MHNPVITSGRESGLYCIERISECLLDKTHLELTNFTY